MFKKRKTVGRFYLLTAGLLLLVLINRFFLPLSSYVNNAVSVVMYPILFVQKQAGNPVHDFFQREKSRQQLERELNALVKIHEDLLAEVIELRASVAYHNDISELIDFKKRYNFSDAAVVQVLLKHFDSQSHFFLIDKGSRHGVEVDMIAAYKNNLVGKVVEVYPFYSKLLLITDRSCKVAAYCAKTKTSGIHVGNNAHHVTVLERVTHLSDILVDDLIISSGEGTVFPRGFALGRITTSQKKGLYVAVVAKPIVDFSKISHCMLMRKGEASATV